jgi:hypothetical protein
VTSKGDAARSNTTRQLLQSMLGAGCGGYLHVTMAHLLPCYAARMWLHCSFSFLHAAMMSALRRTPRVAAKACQTPHRSSQAHSGQTCCCLQPPRSGCCPSWQCCRAQPQPASSHKQHGSWWLPSAALQETCSPSSKSAQQQQQVQCLCQLRLPQ